MRNIFQIVVIPSNSSAAAALYYKSSEAADIAHKNLHDAQKGIIPAQILVAKDDFGHVLTIDKEDISYVLLIDCVKQQELNQYLGASKSKQSQFIPGV